MIYLMRHGLDDETKIGGWSDVGLTVEGKKQVEEIGKKCFNLEIEKIIASDVKRCRQTSLIIQKYINKPIIYNCNLREQSKGDLNGMNLIEAKRKYAKLLENVTPSTVYPNGESLHDLYLRIKKLLPWILSQDKVLFVTHRGVINMIYYLLNDIELDMNKNQFNVTHASIHELDSTKKLIKRRF